MIATIGHVTLAVATARSQRDRNEDAIGLGGWVIHGDSPDPLEISVPVRHGAPLVVVVADGMGGAPDGDLAARLAADELSRQRPSAKSATDHLMTAFELADAAVRAATGTHNEGMGSTAAALIIDRYGRGMVANLGDVRVYRVLDGYPGQLTEDHRLADDASTVSRCLGGRHAPTRPYTREVSVLPGDRLLLCTDGVHDALEAHQIRAAVTQPHPHRATCELISAATATQHGDNATVVVLDVHGITPKR